MSVSAAAAFRDAIECVLPTEPGYHARRATLNIDEAPCDEGLLAMARRAAEEEDADRKRHHGKPSATARDRTMLGKVMEIVTTHGPITQAEFETRAARYAIECRYARKLLLSLVMGRRVRRKVTKASKWEPELCVYEVATKGERT